LNACLEGATHQDPNLVLNFLYNEIVECLFFSSCDIMPNLSYVMGIKAKYNNWPKQTPCNIVSRIMEYLKCWRSWGCVINVDNHLHTLSTYCDLDYYKATLMIANHTLEFFFLWMVCLVTWVSWKQPCMANNTIEFEYIVGSTTTREIVWLKWLLKKLGFLKAKLQAFNDKY